MDIVIESVSINQHHTFSKPPQESINLIAGYGIEGDAHAGEFVQHLFLKKRNPTAPNLRQVHLIHAKLLDELKGKGYPVQPGDLGENITVRGVDLAALPTDTLLKVGESAVLRVTGTRDPCFQIDRFMEGVQELVTTRDEVGNVTGRCGVMTVVEAGGVVQPGDRVEIVLPPEPHTPLKLV